MSSNRLSIETLQGDLILKPAVEGTASDPVVSVVTVCFNPLKDGREELFVKNLDSVQEQTGVTVEHIVVDGASTDGTLDLVRQYDNPHHEIRLFSKADSGIYEAMNRGIALARGKYITFLNTDDFYHQSNGLALSVKALKESNCSFSFAPIQPTGSRFRHRLHRHPESHLHRFFLFCTIPHPSMLFLKSSLMEIDGYDCSYQLAADYDMMLRLVAANSLELICFIIIFIFADELSELAPRETSLRTWKLNPAEYKKPACSILSLSSPPAVLNTMSPLALMRRFETGLIVAESPPFVMFVYSGAARDSTAVLLVKPWKDLKLPCLPEA